MPQVHVVVSMTLLFGIGAAAAAALPCTCVEDGLARSTELCLLLTYPLDAGLESLDVVY